MPVQKVCIIYVVSSKNNIIVTVSNVQGDVLFSKTAGGVCQYESISRTLRCSGEVWKELGEWVAGFLTFKFPKIRHVGFYFKGNAKHRWAFLSNFLWLKKNSEVKKNNYQVLFLSDITQSIHNGCKNRRRPRLKMCWSKRNQKL